MKFNLEINQLDNLVDYLIEKVDKKDIIILLRGTLASGKTTLVKKFVENIGIKDIVTSPTFSIQSIYGDNIYHYDIYNKTLNEFISLGLLEEFEKSGIHFVEWGDEKLEKILKEYGFNFLIISISKNDDKNRREYIIES
jgi:tRNA threonylcarbamoyladenosine biosynthesis protein TsaE